MSHILAEASQRIQPNMGELFPALKVRPPLLPPLCFPLPLRARWLSAFFGRAPMPESTASAEITARSSPLPACLACLVRLSACLSASAPISASLPLPGFACPPACLQARLADSNRNLAAKVLILLGDIARAMGPPFDARARPALLFPAVANLSDNKKQVGGLWRAGDACMHAWG